MAVGIGKNIRFLNIVFAFLFLAMIGTIGLLRCARDNPFDPGSSTFEPGERPAVFFIADSIGGFIKDSIAISIGYKDFFARGGGVPSVKKLLFRWNSGSNAYDDSATVTGDNDTVTIAKFFKNHLNNIAYVWARDNDDSISHPDTMRLVIDEGKPLILALNSLQSVTLIGDTVSVFVSSYNPDSSNSYKEFVWTVNNSRNDVISRDSTFKVVFTGTGIQTIVVKVMNGDSTFSDPDTIKILSTSRTDSIAPVIKFESPESDTVFLSNITVVVSAADSSGILLLLINDIEVKPFGGTEIQGTFKASMVLNEGPNLIRVRAWDTKSNPSTKTRTIVYIKPDLTPPSITFTSPQPNDTVYESPVQIVVSVVDPPSGVAWVKCNGDSMVNQSGSSFKASVKLKEEGNSCVITTADKKGNQGSDTLEFTYVIRDKTPPTVTIHDPQRGIQTAKDSIEVRVAATDSGPNSSGIDSVVINEVPVSLDAGLYTRTVALKHGHNTIRVVATDASASRNKKGDSVIVVRNIAPYFTIASKFMDTSLVRGRLAEISLCAADADNDLMTFAFLDTLSMPAKSSTSPRVVSTTPGCAKIVDYTPSAMGLDTFKVTVTDAFNAIDTIQVKITIFMPGATKPEFALHPGMIPDTAVAGVTYNFILTASDPNKKPLEYSLGTSPSGATIHKDSGKVAWTPAIADTGKERFVAYITNGTESDTLEWLLTVIAKNQKPKLDIPRDTTIYEKTQLRIALSASDPEGDMLVYKFGSLFPPGSTLDSLSGIFTWTPSYSASGTYKTVFRVTERGRSPSLSDSATVTITVKNFNNPPVLVKLPDTFVYENAVLSITLKATDINGDNVSFSPKGALPENAAINGTLFSWRPSTSQGGTVSAITVYAIDNGQPVMRDSATFTIRVRDSISPVFLSHPPLDTVYTGGSYQVLVKAVDRDNDPVTFLKLAGPGDLYVDQKDGKVTWNPLTAQARQPVSIRAVDHAGNADTLSWEILVLSKWPRIFSGGANTQDTGFCVVQTINGQYALCGTSTEGTKQVPFLIKTDTMGNLEMHKKYGINTSFTSLQETTYDGGFIICGTDYSGINSRLLLVKTKVNGDTIWTQRFGTLSGGPAAGTGNVKGISVIQTNSGYLACGVSSRYIGAGVGTIYEIFVVRVSQSGDVVWSKVYSGGVNAVAYSIQQNAIDNSFIVTGSATLKKTGASSSAFLMKANLNTGDTLWIRIPRIEGTVRSAGVSIIPTLDGYIIGGSASSSFTGNQTNGLLMKVDSKGELKWSALLDAGSAIHSVQAVTRGSEFIACGSQEGIGVTGKDVLLHRFTSDGADVWTKRIGSSLDDGGYSVFPTNDDGFIVTGFTTPVGSFGNTDVYLVKTTSKGAIVK